MKWKSESWRKNIFGKMNKYVWEWKEPDKFKDLKIRERKKTHGCDETEARRWELPRPSRPRQARVRIEEWACHLGLRKKF